jgi:hypothetical protein
MRSFFVGAVGALALTGCVIESQNPIISAMNVDSFDVFQEAFASFSDAY